MKRDLAVFLQKLNTELERSSKEYREEQANKRPHLFRFNSKRFADELKRQITAQNIPLSNADRKFINIEAGNLLVKLKQKLTLIKAENKKITLGKNFVRMTFTSSVGITPQFGDPDSIYGKVYDAYRPCLKESFLKIQTYLREQEFKTEKGRTKKKTLRTKTGKERQAAGRVLNLGHIEGKSVIESFIRDAFDNVLDTAPVFTDSGTALNETDIRRELQNLGIDLKILKDAKIDTYVVELEADSANKEAGRVLKENKKKLQDQIKAAQKKLGGIANLKGSISIAENKKRKARKKVINAFKGVGSEVTVIAGEELKEDLRRSSSKKKSKAKATKAKTRRPSLTGALPSALKARRVAPKKGIASDMLRMIAMINKELPKTVRDNMQQPALQNRTGRFVNSVKVTEVVQTPKGFPSIGYTYQKNPYQVYEMGVGEAPWATPERDPRKLIDRSIREIATKLAIGRFFTRRV